MRPGFFLDLKSGWNLSSSTHLEKAWARLTETQLSLVVLSPLRRSLCGDQEIQKIASIGGEDLEHIEANRYFFFQFPWNAWSWQLLEVVEVTRMGGVCGSMNDTSVLAGCKW